MFVHNEASPVRLLHIVGESRFGGVARIILGLGRVAQAEGWQVDVLTTDPVVQKVVIDHGLGLVNLDVIRREIRPLWDLGGLFRLYKFLRTERYHIVQTHTSKGGFVGRLAAQLAGVPVILHTAHGFAFHEGSPAVGRLFYSALERIASRWCDRVVTVSEFHRDWAIQLGICNPRRITAIPNGVVEAPRNQRVGLAELQCQLGVRPGDLVILSISRLAADKGLNYLIQAAAMLPATDRSTHIVIAGDGPAREQLKELADRLGVRDRVTFAGFREDVGDLLAACDVVILPSLREGLSISLLEALAAGKPVIATSIGSQREVASHGEAVLLVPPTDVPALAQAILRLAEDCPLRARLSANARAVYRNFYTEDRMLSAYWQLYGDLLRAKCQLETATRIRSFDSVGRTTVRKATANDLTSIVTIHQKAFRGFFLTRLGSDFLRRYYSLVLDYHLGIMLVSEGRQNVLEGFACGFVDPPGFYQLMWATKWNFILPILSALVRQPAVIKNVIYGIQRIHSPAMEWAKGTCELSSIAVAPDTTGKGLGKALIREFLTRAQSMDARCVYLTTDAAGNDSVNKFYRNVGFQHTRRFLQHQGRWMNEYVINGLERSNAREDQ